MIEKLILKQYILYEDDTDGVGKVIFSERNQEEIVGKINEIIEHLNKQTEKVDPYEILRTFLTNYNPIGQAAGGYPHLRNDNSMGGYPYLRNDNSIGQPAGAYPYSEKS